jgi:hypothetical protein
MLRVAACMCPYFDNQEYKEVLFISLTYKKATKDRTLVAFILCVKELTEYLYQ